MAVTGVASAGTGLVSGTVTDGSNALSGIAVASFDGVSGAPGPATTTDGSGAFSLSLPDGAHLLRFSDPAGSFATEFHPGAATVDAASPVTVTDGLTTTVDADLTPATGLLEGHVTDTWSSSPLDGIVVTVIDDTTGAVVGSTTTADDPFAGGGYFALAVPADRPLLTRFSDPTGEYPTTFGPPANEASSATPVSVAAGTELSLSIEMIRDRAVLQGDLDDGTAPVEGARVTVIDPRTGGIAGEATADATGHYDIEVPSGEYLVHLEGTAGLHVPQFHDGSLRADHASPVSLAPGDDRTVEPTLTRDRGWIGGEVTAVDLSSGSHIGLESIVVDVIDVRTGDLVATTATSGDGAQPGLFETELPSGDFVLRFTDPNGDYRTEFYPDASAADHALAIQLEAGAAETGLHVVLDPVVAPLDHTISGSISTGPSSQGVTVTAYEPETLQPVSSQTVPAVGGSFSLQVPAGRYLISAVDDYSGYEPRWYELGSSGVATVDDATAVSGGTSSLNLGVVTTWSPPTVGASLVGTVNTGSGGPEATVQVFDAGTGRLVGTDATTSGVYQVHLTEGTGSYVVRAEVVGGGFLHNFHGGGLNRTAADATQVPVGITDVTGVDVGLQKAEARLTGTVAGFQVVGSDPFGDLFVLEGATIEIFALTSGDLVATTTTDGSGRFDTTVATAAFRDHGDGVHFAVRAIPPTAEQLTAWWNAPFDSAGTLIGSPVRLWSGESEDLLFELRPAVAPVRGTVGDLDFDPVSGVVVDVFDVATGRLVDGVAATTDATGSFETLVPVTSHSADGGPTRVMLRFSDPGSVTRWAGQSGPSGQIRSNTAFELFSGAGPTSIRQELTRATATIQGTAREEIELDPLADIRIEAFDVSTGLLVADAVTDVDGLFSLEVPAPTMSGEGAANGYLLRAVDPAEEYEPQWLGRAPFMSHTSRVDVFAADVRFGQDFGLVPATGTATGTVVVDDASANAIGGAEIEFLDATTGELAGTATTDSAGSYATTLPAGDYLVRASHSSYAPEWHADGENLFAGTRVMVVAAGLPTVVDFALAVPNEPPTVDAGAAATGDEGAPVALSGTATDPDADPLALSWSYSPGAGVDAGASCSFSAPAAATTSITCDDDGTYTATLTADDGINDPVSDDVTVAVGNVAPTTGSVTPSTTDPVAVGTAVSVSMPYGDLGANDTHTASIDWDDGTATPATAVSGALSGSHEYATAGVYTIAVAVTDDDAASATSIYEYVVVYDPDAGFVTGGGWYESQAGAYTPDTALSGKASFGFVSKYKKGASVPTGKTEFQFRVADLTFRSTSYEWLVVTGGDVAKFKGVGTINDSGEYQFQIWAGDAAPDTFRIRIWFEDEAGAEHTVYDNGRSQPIDGGSIVIHNGK